MLRVGIIGSGTGTRNILPGFESTGRAKVNSIVTSSLDSARRISEHYLIDNVFQNTSEMCASGLVDLVAICTPNYLHKNQIIEALEYNIPILVEKPIVISSQDALELLSLIKPDQWIHINHQLRFDKRILMLRNILNSRRVGRLYHIDVKFQNDYLSNPQYPFNWHLDVNSGGGNRLSSGSHLIDLLLFLRPEHEISSVFAHMERGVPFRADKDNNSKEIHASSMFSAAMQWSDDVSTSLFSSSCAYRTPMFKINIYGSEAEVELDMYGEFSIYQSSSKTRLLDVPSSENPFRSSFRLFSQTIVDTLVNGKPKLVEGAATVYDGYRGLLVTDAIMASHNLNQNVILKETGSPKKIF